MAQVTIRQQFLPDTEIKLYPRVGDYPNTGTADPIDTQKVDDESNVQFTGLKEGTPYWAVQEPDDEARTKLKNEIGDAVSSAVGDRDLRVEDFGETIRVTVFTEDPQRRVIAVTAKEEPEGRVAREDLPAELAPQTRPLAPQKQTVTGARDTRTIRGPKAESAAPGENVTGDEDSTKAAGDEQDRAESRTASRKSSKTGGK